MTATVGAEPKASAAKLFKVKWVDSVSEIDPAFFKLCFSPTLEGLWWYETLEQSGLEDQFEFAYALIFEDSKPIAIAPTFLMNVPMELIAPPEVVKLVNQIPLLGKVFPFLVYQRTLFVGSPCADEGSIGLIPNKKLIDIAPTLQNALLERAKQTKADMVTWKDFCEDDARVLAGFAQSVGMFKVPSYPGTMVSLPASGLSGYYSQLKSSRRYNLRKKLKRSKERLAIETQVVQNPSEPELDEIFGLFMQTYERADMKFEHLNRRFFELIAQKPVSYFVLLRNQDSGQLVAFMLCFKLGEKVINKFIGLDYKVAEETHLYFRLWEAALEWVIAGGATEFQSGQTGYRAKIDIGNTLIPLTNFCKHRNPAVHKIYELVAKSISWSTLDHNLAEYLKAHPEEAPPVNR
jgi:hypothetical protein